jgi:hypothetical protein
MTEILSSLTTPALIALTVGAGLLVVVTDWRLSFAALLVVYAGMTIVLSPLVLLEVAGAKFLVGALVVAILALTGAQLKFGRAEVGEAPRPPTMATPTNLPFRLAAALMAGAAAWYVAAQPNFKLPGLDTLPAVNSASFLLMTLGLLNIGLTEEPINAGMGLLVLLLGFELFYAAVEPSLAVMALLVGVEFAIALAVSYLALVAHRPSSAPETT